MSYSLGQFRRDQMDSYYTNIDFTQGILENDTTIITFYDPCLFFTGTNVLSSLYSYYLQFDVTQRTDSIQSFTVKLTSNEVEEDNTQSVRTLTVPQGTGVTSFELILHPNATYNELVFELSRLALDFTMDNGDGTNGRIMDVTITNFYLITNVIANYLTLKYDDLEELKKIGIQGPPGLMFVIDGEEIRIGRTGIYELYNDNISIAYLGFIVKESTMTQDGKDYFIMDFRY